jgi:hypothetical protein
VARWLGPEQTGVVASGDARLADVARQALLESITALAQGDGAGDAVRVNGLADLLEVLGESVPFDAQTLFARVRDQAGPARARGLASVGRRLGFT